MAIVVLALGISQAWCASSSVTITSQPFPSKNPALTGELVTFTAAATDANGGTITYTWQFGDGVVHNTTTGSIQHRYSAKGVYTLIVAFSGSVGGVVGQPFNLTIDDPSPPAPVGPGVDTDGDGFSDLFEIQMGSDPNNAASTPAAGSTITAANVESMTVTKAKLVLQFGKKGKTMISLSGTLLAQQGFSSANQTFMVNIGGAAFPFALGKTGKGSVGKSKFSIATKGKAPKTANGKTRDGIVVGPGVMEYNWNVTIEPPPDTAPPPSVPYPFQPPPTDPPLPNIPGVTLGDLLEFLQDEGFINANIGIKTSGGFLGLILDFPIGIFTKKDVFYISTELNYIATEGKSGTATLPNTK